MNENGIPDYWEERWIRQTIEIKATRGEYLSEYNFDPKDLYASDIKVRIGLSKDDASSYHRRIADENGGALQFDMLGFVEGIGLIKGIIDMIRGISHFDDYSFKDSHGNTLYIEEGYSIVEYSRVYIGRAYSAAETEFIVLDGGLCQVFDMTFRISYLID